jgi:hypothetical protein
MKDAAAALVAFRTVGPYDETVGRKPAKAVESEAAAEVAKRRLWRLVHPADPWTPTHARP